MVKRIGFFEKCVAVKIAKFQLGEFDSDWVKDVFEKDFLCEDMPPK